MQQSIGMRMALATIAFSMLTPILNAGGCRYPFSLQAQPLITQLSAAKGIVVASLVSSTQKHSDGTDDPVGTTTFKIHNQLKAHPILNGKTFMAVGRYIPVTPKTRGTKFVIFYDIFQSKIDAYQGLTVQAAGGMPEYIHGLLKAAKKPIAQQLLFTFDYLRHPDSQVALDAFLLHDKLLQEDYPKWLQAARQFPPKKLYQWLQQKKLLPGQMTYFALALSHCCKDAVHAEKVCRALLAKTQKKEQSVSRDRIYQALILLTPKEGMATLSHVASNPRESFMNRYCCLRALRFFLTERKGTVPRPDLLKLMGQLLQQSDITDIVIEDLRKMNCWQFTTEILDLVNRKQFDEPIVQRAVLRYAITCPDTPCKGFLAERKRQDKQMVTDVEEILRLESGK